VLVATPTTSRTFAVTLDGADTDVPDAVGMDAPRYVLPVADGLGYGLFTLDPTSLAYLTDPASPAFRTTATRATNAATTAPLDALGRGAARVAIWEAMLDGQVPPDRVRDALVAALPSEDVELNVQMMLSELRSVFWRFTSPDNRVALAPRIEDTLIAGLTRASSSSLKSAWFSALQSVALTPPTLNWLERVWRHDETIPGLPLAEADEAELAMELAVRGVPASSEILDAEPARIKNADRKARFTFVMPALSRDASIRQQFFDSLADVKNRQHEAWVLEALGYLNHPLRADTSQAFIRPALSLVREIQRTGDIFFPKRWTDASLRGYQSPDAAAAVRAFLDSLPSDYPARLRWVIESSADPLFRAAKIAR
jgi:aminopeptidase N